eukprot:7366565-Prymnesium_polylepis.2
MHIRRPPSPPHRILLPCKRSARCSKRPFSKGEQHLWVRVAADSHGRGSQSVLLGVHPSSRSAAQGKRTNRCGQQTRNHKGVYKIARPRHAGSLAVTGVYTSRPS